MVIGNPEATWPCERHPDEMVVWEEGGVDKPTIFGRHHCVKCDHEFAALLDQIEQTKVIRRDWS